MSSSLLRSALVALSLFTATSALVGCSADTSEDDVGDQSQDAVGENAVARAYKGKIGNLEVMVRLEKNGNALSGSYFYVGKATKGETIALSGSSTSGKLSLEEKVGAQKTGSFSGTIERGGKLKGTWKTPDGARSLPFTLDAVTAPVAVKREIKDSAPLAEPTEFRPTCDVEVSYYEVFGLADAAAEKKANEALAGEWTTPIPRTAAGKCDDEAMIGVSATSTIKLQDKDVLSIEIAGETNGGAYPNHSLEWINIGTKTGRVFTLKDSIKQASLPAVKAKVVAALRARAVAEGGEPSDMDYLVDIAERSFESPENIAFEVRAEGINISYFNSLPHAMQAIDEDGTLVKWADLSGAIVEGSELSAFAR
jgi:hypothetical protein